MSEAKKPSLHEVDRLIEKYAALQTVVVNAKAELETAQLDAEAMKAKLTEVVELYGQQHAGKSKRLTGAHHTATTTTGTVMSVDHAAVDKLKAYLDAQDQAELTKQFFSERVTYQLVNAPGEVLKTLKLATKVRAKITGLINSCFVMKTKATALKVDVVTPA